jgi:hypothetical protein
MKLVTKYILSNFGGRVANKEVVEGWQPLNYGRTQSS